MQASPPLTLPAVPPRRTPVPCSFVIAKDLTTGKDVAYHVKTIAPPLGPGGSPIVGGGLGAARSAGGSRNATPDRAAAAVAESSGFFASPGAAAGSNGGEAGPAEVPAAAAPAAASPAQPLHHQQQQQQHRLPHGHPQQHPQQQGFGHQRHGHAPQHHGQHGQHGQQGQHGQHGRTPYEHFGQHRQPSPASQRDWRLPREPSPAHTGAPAGGQPSRHGSGPPSAEPSGELAAPARYRGTVAQPARAGRHHSMDDGLLLYIDEQGAQQQARYGNGRLAGGQGCRGFLDEIRADEASAADRSSTLELHAPARRVSVVRHTLELLSVHPPA